MREAEKPPRGWDKPYTWGVEPWEYDGLTPVKVQSLLKLYLRLACFSDDMPGNINLLIQRLAQLLDCGEGAVRLFLGNPAAISQTVARNFGGVLAEIVRMGGADRARAIIKHAH